MLPITLSYFILGTWPFGKIGCKMFFAMERVNKLVSIALLMVMCFERFYAVSRQNKLICLKYEYFYKSRFE